MISQLEYEIELLFKEREIIALEQHIQFEERKLQNLQNQRLLLQDDYERLKCTKPNN